MHRRFPRLIGLLLLGGMLLVNSPLAEGVIFSRSGVNGAWEDDPQWSGTGFPDDISDDADFQDGAFGVVTLGADYTIGSLNVGFLTGDADRTASLTLDDNGSSRTLSVGNAATGGTIRVGSSRGITNAGNPFTTDRTAIGTLNIEAGTTVNLVGGNFHLGSADQDLQANDGDGTSFEGTLNMQTGASLNVGTALNPSLWMVGRNRDSDAPPQPIAQGTFTPDGGDLTANLEVFQIGVNFRGGAETHSDIHRGIGTVDLTNLESAEINTERLIVGQAFSAGATGSITVGNNHQLNVVETSGNTLVSIGISAGNASFGFLGGNYSTTGILTMNSGSEVNFGSSTHRADVTLGRNTSSRATTTTWQGTLLANGGTFAGLFNDLVIGQQDSVAALHSSQTITAEGSMDLLAATIATFDVAGDVSVGFSNLGRANSIGALRLSPVQGLIGGNLVVGDNVASGSGSGVLELDGAHLELSSTSLVDINNRGSVDVHVAADSAGLSLLNSAASALDVTTTGLSGYEIVFTQDPNASLFTVDLTPGDATDILYGLKWAGDHTASGDGELSNLLGSGQLTADDTTFLTGVFFDSATLFYHAPTDATYYGIALEALSQGTVPEPQTFTLVLLGVSSLFFRRRSRR